jgi:hypothetical protein
MENQHRLIVGCRDLGKTEIDLINEVKKTAVLVGATVERVALSASVDKQWAEIARVHLQQGFMALDRAVAKPNSF